MSDPQDPGHDGPPDELWSGEETIQPTEEYSRGAAAGNPPGRKLGVTVPSESGAPKIKGVTIQGVIGKGGQGLVYRGVQDFISRKVAIKVLLKDAGKAYEDRFRREAKILAGLQHPHIVACYHAGVTELGECYLLMELVEGPDLDRYVRRNGPLDPCSALQVAHDAATALQNGFEASVIHRDVKPQNILLSPTGEDDPFPYRAKLADLGLARVTDDDLKFSRLTMAGAIMGTPSTMAPEQFDDPDLVDFRADIYGLGCVLYHALVGKAAFGGQTFTEIFKVKVSGEYPNVREKRPELSEPLSNLVARMLATDPNDRQQSYVELIEDLQTEIQRAGECQAGTGAKSRRAPAMLAGLAVLGLASGAAFWTTRQDSSSPDGKAAPSSQSKVPADRTDSGKREVDPATGPGNLQASAGEDFDRPAVGEPAPGPAGAEPAADGDEEASAGAESSVLEEGPELLQPNADSGESEASTLEGKAAPESAPDPAPTGPLLTAGPPMPRAATLKLFEAWDHMNDILGDWSFDPAALKGRWHGDEDDIHIVRASHPKLRTECGYPLPAGSWRLSGVLRIEPMITLNGLTEDPVSGVCIDMEDGSRLQLKVTPQSSGGTRLACEAYAVREPGGSWKLKEDAAVATLLDSGQDLGFLLTCLDNQLVFQLASSSDQSFTVPVNQGARPARLTLFVSNGTGHWFDFVLTGL